MSDHISWSFGRNQFDNMPINRSGSWYEFLSFMFDHRAAAKGLNYITSAMGNDGRRCKANAQPRNWLAFDFDGKKIEVDGKQKSIGTTDEKAAALVGFFSGLKSACYQTASSAPGARKMRFITKCDRDINENESKALGALIQSLTPSPDGFDKSVYQSAQPIFMPPLDQSIVEFDGDELPADILLASIPAPAPKRVIHRSYRTDVPDGYGFFSRNGLILSESAGSGFDVCCPWAAAHTDADITGSVFFPPSADNNMAGGFKCQHSSCSHKTIADVYKLIEGLK